MGRGIMRGLWSEIRRRHVPRVAAYYVAGAWVVAQAASLLLDAFDAQHYTRYVIGALAVGLPVALALAWVFDITPRGIERTQAAGATRAGDTGTELAPVQLATAAAPVPEHSVAVLPFANLSDDPANEYFSDGLSEEIRNQLARMTGLRVAARTSSFAFKGRHQDVREIGRQLGVAAILEGGVRKHAGTVRIDLQLVSTADGYQTWSQSFERRLDDIFQLQTEIACAVTAAVSQRHAEPERIAHRPETQNFAAYNAYLLGRHHFHKRTEHSLRRAVACFEEAIAIDPAYALAYSGLSDACILLTVRHYGNLSSSQAIERALPAARRALELDPGLAEAHASLGVIELQRGEFRAAEDAFRRARELNPGYTMALVWLGLALNAEGRYRDATAVNREAFRLDPLSPIVNSNVAFDALRFGDLEEAGRRFATAHEIDPGFLVPYSGIARIHAAHGELREALGWIERAIALAPTRSFFHARKGLLLLQLGEMDAAAGSIETACSSGSSDVVEPELAVALHVARVDRDALERVANARPGAAFSDDQRAQAFLALGDFAAAGNLYERTAPSPALEINDILGGDWIWRLPHAINRAHVQLQSGDPRGRATLEEYLAGVAQARAGGIVNVDLLYRAATAHGLLGRTEQALAQLEEAVRLGWRHAWWGRADVNLSELASDPRCQTLLARASGQVAGAVP